VKEIFSFVCLALIIISIITKIKIFQKVFQNLIFVKISFYSLSKYDMKRHENAKTKTRAIKTRGNESGRYFGRNNICVH